MTDRLFVFQRDATYSTETEETSASFDVSYYGSLLDADIGYALAADGTPLSEYYVDELTDQVLDVDWRSVASGYHERFVPVEESVLSIDVRLQSGETASIHDYDTVLVTQVIFHTAYVHYVCDQTAETTVIGVQDESLQDVMSFSPELKLHHRRSLSNVDGFISEDGLYHDWVSPVVDRIHFIPLLAPKNHFAGLTTSDGSSGGKICLGSATHNVLPSNFYTSVLALDCLREMGHDIQGEIIGVADWQADELSAFPQLDAVETRSFVDDGFYELLAGFEIAIAPTARVSAGRISAEFAAAGVPCIGNSQNDLQRRCFPDLCVDPYDTSTIVSLAHRLLSDSDFRKRTGRRAQERLHEILMHETASRRLRQFVESVEGDG